MFTGIVRERARVASFEGGRLVVESGFVAGIGDSVAVDGVCLTVVEASDGRGASNPFGIDQWSNVRSHVVPPSSQGARCAISKLPPVFPLIPRVPTAAMGAPLKSMSPEVIGVTSLMFEASSAVIT